MEYISLGATGLLVSRTAISGRSFDELEPELVQQLVKSAFTGGINYFATSHLKPESEKILGAAIKDFKDDVIVSTTTSRFSAQELRLTVDESLENLGLEKIHLLLLEDLKFIPEKNAADGIYSALENLIAGGKVLHIGFITEDFELAKNFLDKIKNAQPEEQSLFEVIAHPFNMLCPEEICDFANECSLKEIGFIAQKPLCGGIITNLPLALGFLRQFEDTVPVWSVKNEDELQQILYFTDNPPVQDEQFQKEADLERAFFN